LKAISVLWWRALKLLNHVLLAIEVDLEDNDFGIFGPAGKRFQHGVLCLAGRAPGRRDVNQNGPVGDLGFFEARAIEFSLLESGRRGDAGDRHGEREQGSGSASM
jgi:hypothetical protein